jgi:hypothetical protein
MPLALHCTSRETGYKIVLSDMSDVVGQHYAVAVDIYDPKNSALLNALLATMNQNDTVTLITFGDHIESRHFNMTDKVPEIVNEMLNRREHGCNVASALYELDQTKCDCRVLISNGAYDDGAAEVEIINKISLVSHGQPSYPVIQNVLVTLMAVHSSSRVSVRKQMRQLLDKPRPNYYNIVVIAGTRHFVPPLAFGGETSIYVGEFEGKIQLSYSNADGDKFTAEIQI